MGKKEYSQVICRDAQLIENFYVSPVFESDTEGIYRFQLRNHRKQTITFSLWDEAGSELKSLTLNKEPKGARELTLDMKAYPPGLYRLKAVAGGHSYDHAFSKK